MLVVVISIFSLQAQWTQIFPVIRPESGSEAYFTPGHPLTVYWISHWFSRYSISHFSEGQINRLQRNNQQTQTQDPGLTPRITMAQHRHQIWPHFLGTPHNPHLASRIGNTPLSHSSGNDIIHGYPQTGKNYYSHTPPWITNSLRSQTTLTPPFSHPYSLFSQMELMFPPPLSHSQESLCFDDLY